ncbi:MAG: hypothetical protein JNK33_07085, partial [Candidatus Doudnabacteria bacterium]|nr:hypothetical protein [Candidatus Doudnabacteria bacterium]
NTVDIDVDVTAVGPYSISTTPVNGMTFSASGTFVTTGVQTITLVGSGTPTTDGTFNITMPGTTTCTFPVDVDAAPVVEWQFTAASPSVTFSGETDNAQLLSLIPPITNFAYAGSNATDDIVLGLADISGGINVGETYNTLPGPGNFATFIYDVNLGTDQFTTDGTRNLTFTVTAHNTVAKTITITFSGNVRNSAGT